MKNLFKLSIFLFLGIVLFNSNAFADIPNSIVFQGRLTDNTGAPITASNKTFKFDFHTAASGGAAAFSITATGVNISNGLYSVILDFNTATPLAGVNLNQPLFVQVTYDTTNIIGGRTALGSSPYAMTVKDSSITTTKIADNSITLSKLSAGTASNGSFLSINGSNLLWTTVSGTIPSPANPSDNYKYLMANSGNSVWSKLEGTGLSNIGGTISVTNPLPAEFPILSSGHYLTNNGTSLSWSAISGTLPTGGTNGQYLTTDGTDSKWSTLTFGTGLKNTAGTIAVTNPLPVAFPPTLTSGHYLTNDGIDLSWAAISGTLPTGGTNGQYLTTDGTDSKWSTLTFGTGLKNTAGTIAVTNPLPVAFPPTLTSGHYLTNDGIDLSWAAISGTLPTGGTNGQYLTTDGTDSKWSTLTFGTGLKNTAGTIAVTNPLPVAFPPTLTSGHYLTNDGIDLSWAAISGTLPTGGTNGQYLTTDGTDSKWSTLTFGTGLKNTAGTIAVTNPLPVAFPPTLTSGHYLTNDGIDLSWSAIPAALPAGGTDGQYLTINASGPAWAQVDSIPVSPSTNLIQSGAVFTALSTKQDQIVAGTIGEVLTYTATAGTLGSLGFDTAPASASNNLMVSGAIYTALEGKVDKDSVGNVVMDGTLNIGGTTGAELKYGIFNTTTTSVSGLIVDTNLRVNGIVSSSDGFLNENADLAEIYPSSDILSPGDVVIISETRDGYIEKSKLANDTKVAGVISTKPGIVLNSESIGYQLALVGKVPVSVTNEGGNIKRGDLLVASSTPGHAMKATDPKPGTVIGKALENSTGSRGKISVLVNLQ